MAQDEAIKRLPVVPSPSPNAASDASYCPLSRPNSGRSRVHRRCAIVAVHSCERIDLLGEANQHVGMARMGATAATRVRSEQLRTRHERRVAPPAALSHLLLMPLEETVSAPRPEFPHAKYAEVLDDRFTQDDDPVGCLQVVCARRAPGSTGPPRSSRGCSPTPSRTPGSACSAVCAS